MVKVTVESDCGNAPRKEFLKQFHIALANSDSTFVIENITDNIHWEIVGNHTITNKEEFEKRILDTRLKKNYNLSLNLLEPARYGKDASVSTAGVFEDFNRVLREKGLQLGFIDTQSDEYIALLHRVKDRKRVEKAVKNIGYAYYE